LNSRVSVIIKIRVLKKKYSVTTYNTPDYLFSSDDDDTTDPNVCEPRNVK